MSENKIIFPESIEDINPSSRFFGSKVFPFIFQDLKKEMLNVSSGEINLTVFFDSKSYEERNPSSRHFGLKKDAFKEFK